MKNSIRISMGILCVVFTLLLNIGSATLPIPGAHAPVSQLSDLPLDAQFAVSSLLGRAETAYHIQSSQGVLRGENPEQNLLTEWDASGLSLFNGQNRLHLRLTGYGYANNLFVLTTSAPHASENRVEYSHLVPGKSDAPQLTEWYVNGPLGIQQGFTLSAPPSRQNDGAPLQLVLEFSGDMYAQTTQDSDTLTFLVAQGRPLLYYRDLQVTDATGRELEAWLDTGENADRALSGSGTATTFSIQINDSDAAYPITIDPFVQRAKLTASDKGDQDQLGHSVAISNNVVVVGAPYHQVNGNSQGTAYVFVKPAQGWTNMTQTAKLTASNGATGDMFGYAVAIEEDEIVVGAPGVLGKGSAYVFVKPVNGWTSMTQTAQIDTSDGFYQDWFGKSIAISGDTVAVGDPFNDSATGDVSVGGVYIFLRSPSGWSNMTQTAKLTASDGVAWDKLGTSVEIDGDTIVAGAEGDENYKGSAYVFVKGGGGWSNMTESAKLTASDGAAGDRFGSSVAINTDTLVIGADSDDIDGNSGQGSAYVFVKPGTGWASISETAKLTATGWEVEGFGESVAIKDATIIVGAPAVWGCPSCPAVGAAYVFVKPAAGWISTTEASKLLASDGEQMDMFGAAVDYSDRVLVVGAKSDNFGTEFNQGSAYIFPLMPQKPKAVYPSKGVIVPKRKVPLDWEDTASADTYKVIVREGSKTGTIRLNVQGLTASQALTPKLQRGKTYYWRIGACNVNGCTNAPWLYFTIKP